MFSRFLVFAFSRFQIRKTFIGKHGLGYKFTSIWSLTGYLRVSTANQDIEKNKSDILLFANDKRIEPVSWVWEIISGRINWKKRKIAEVLLKLGKGDNIIV